MTMPLPPPATYPKRVGLRVAVLGPISATALAVAVVAVSDGLPSSSVPAADRPLALGTVGVPLLAALAAACWLLVADHPASAVGLSSVGLAWVFPALAAWPFGAAHIRSAVLAAAPLAVAGCAIVADGWQLASTRRNLRAWMAVFLASGAALAHLVGYDPFFDAGCRWTCAAAPAPLSAVLGPRQAIVLTVACTVAAAVFTTITSVQSRWTPTTVRIATVAATGLIVAGIAAPLWQPASTTVSLRSDVLQTAGTLIIVLATLVAALRTRIVRRKVRVLTQLTGSTIRPQGIDGSVNAVHFAVPDEGRWVDAVGRPVADPVGRTVVLLGHDGPAVRLLLGRWTDPALALAAITPAGRLALENARLHAAGIVRLADLRASQRRIVETADNERRRIERDLHDGAQQRLVAVTMHLSSARAQRDVATSRTLAAAEAHVQRALAALRELSHESFAAVLAAEGLAASVEDLTAGSPGRVELETALTGRPLSWPVQMTAFVAATEGLDNVVKHAPTARAHVTIADDGAEITVRVSDDGPGGAFLGPSLTELADRVGALGGHLDLASSADRGTSLMVRLPCESW